MCCVRHLCVLFVCLLISVSLGSALLVLSRGASEYDAQLQTRMVSSGRSTQPWLCGQCFESANSQSICEQCSKGRHAHAQGIREASLGLASVRAADWAPREFQQDVQRLMLRCLEKFADHYSIFMQSTLLLFWMLVTSWLFWRCAAPSHRRFIDNRHSRARQRLIQERSMPIQYAAQQLQEQHVPPKPSEDHYANMQRDSTLVHRRPSETFIAQQPTQQQFYI